MSPFTMWHQTVDVKSVDEVISHHPLRIKVLSSFQDKYHKVIHNKNGRELWSLWTTETLSFSSQSCIKPAGCDHVTSGTHRGYMDTKVHYCMVLAHAEVNIRILK